ncbi:hypothetical protein WQ53_00445 [Pseudoxanthomonas suwonensis]|uniref:DUF3298 domain-containing protein n=2 Tax=Pseudoxanthomonas suwonensis TaxID=314722 RepID=A0A0E3Z3I3_9GAMM|nr:hypothetical protein WQ53_00445 [Pseudoxanthomonas suwonensis]
MTPTTRMVAAGLLLVALAACRRDEAQAPGAPAGPPAADDAAVPAVPAADAPVALADVIETDPRYVVGISYPPGAADDPGLAQALHGYAEAARGELMQAVAGLDGNPTAPYELSLGFRETLRSADVVAVAADGSLYTGGAHGQPLVARFVWLPRQQRMLTAQDLLASPEDWRPVADYVAEQLGAAAHTRAADEALEPADRQRLLAMALKTIAEGTAPRPENFAQFEPVRSADGRIAALRFVFPPYQVGPYADGVQSVVVPAAVLRPYLAQDIRGLFAE